MKKCVYSVLLVILLIYGLESLEFVFPEEENLVVDKSVTYINTKVVINGNITVLKGGNLTIINSTLYFNSKKREGYVLEALLGSVLIIKSSTIEGPKDKFYSIFIHNDVYLVIEGSVFKNAGWKDQHDSGYYLWVGPAYTNDLSVYGHGVEINSTVESFRGNTFINVASIRFYPSNNIIEDNVIIGVRHEGLAFINSHNNIIRNNVIVNASAIDRETHGIRFYPGTRNEVIYNNTVSHVAKGITVGQVSPWTAGYNFTIHDNRISYVVSGLETKLVDSHIYNECYEHILSNGILLAASRNIVVENCTLKNFTYYPKELSDPRTFNSSKSLFIPSILRRTTIS